MTQSISPDSTTLLPCPFCGGEARFYENWVAHERKWSVGCGDCDGFLGVCEDTKSEAAPLWNTRVPDVAAAPIRTFCKSLGAGTVAVSSDGVERIYYAGMSLDALSVAVALALSSTNSNTVAEPSRCKNTVARGESKEAGASTGRGSKSQDHPLSATGDAPAAPASTITRPHRDSVEKTEGGQ